MRVVVAGSRGVTDYNQVKAAIESSGFIVSTVVSGCAPGPDRLGERWARENGVPVDRFPAQWQRPDGTTDRAAGHKRNREMGDSAEALVALWDGVSPGTKGMIDYATRIGLQVYVYRTDQPAPVATSATYTVYCDGASRKDGRGGWGASIRQEGEPNVDLYGGEYDTTNNRMELMGALEALWYLPPDSVVQVYGDSEYVVKGASEYLDTWIRTGWRTSANKPLKNDDLWREMVAAISRHALVEWFWVRGHSGDEGNERADALSQMGVPEPR